MDAKRWLCVVVVAALVLYPLPASADGPQAVTAEEIIGLPTYGPLDFDPALDCTPERCGSVRQIDQAGGGGGGGDAGLPTWAVVLIVVVVVAALASGGGGGGY